MNGTEVKDYEEWLNRAGEVVCVACNSTKLETTEAGPHIELKCVSCGRHQKYLSKSKKIKLKRPKISSEDKEEIWSSWGNCCSFCGLSAETLKELNIQKEIQHVPPYKENGHEYAIPICEWCNSDAESNRRRAEAMIARIQTLLVKKFDMNGDK